LDASDSGLERNEIAISTGEHLDATTTRCRLQIGDLPPVLGSSYLKLP
jgi:hypothetical protein